MLANIGPWQIGIILLIVIVIFGTKRLRNVGSDLGHGLKGFRELGDEIAKEDDDET